MPGVMRRFTEHDQERFARFSGDWNPMHMDKVAARRTQAGAPVVHGVHLVLWTLDTLIRDGLVPGVVGAVHAVFAKFVYLDAPVEIRVIHASDDAVEAVVSASGVDTTTVTIRLGTPESRDIGALDERSAVTQGRVPNVPALAAMAKQSGWMAPEGDEDLFPHASRAFGARRVGAIALTSRLVGMLVPGLHSVYGSLDIAFVPDHERPGLGFQVVTANVRTRLLRMSVAGSGIAGTIIAFARREPVAQPMMAEVAPLVEPNSCAGAVALVTGGSRGLGALTARILAAGGARVVVTYAIGRDDADTLIADINDFVGADMCSAVRYDIMEDAGVAVAGATHLYHFASPRIYRQKAALFDPGVFAEFSRAYLGAFHDLCRSLVGLRVAFYPSSVFVEPGRPREMTEYAMVKAAGEILCEEMNATAGYPHVISRRLPRMLTDQTATLAKVATADALTTLLQVVRDVQAATGVPA